MIAQLDRNPAPAAAARADGPVPAGTRERTARDWLNLVAWFAWFAFFAWVLAMFRRHLRGPD
jgi:hypothetical protein